MFRPRIIPVLLLRRGALVKSQQFARHRYIGDALNAVRLFNEHHADELVVLDIDATREQRSIDSEMVRRLGEEAAMPLSVGGGINTLQQIRALIAAGAEKVIIGTAACTSKSLVAKAAQAFGSAAITVCMDVKRNWLGREGVYVTNASVRTSFTPETFATEMQQAGAGELIVQSVDDDGMMIGYNISLLRRITAITSFPVVALGGAGSLEHLKQGFTHGHATGLAAGSLFVYKGANKGILINYPENYDFLRD